MSMFPHIVTVYTVTEDPVTFQQTSNITILRGVLLDESKGSNVRTSGLIGADAANLYIPFVVNAVDGVTLFPKKYAGPVEYDRAADKSDIWTLKTGDDSTFFVKGEAVEEDKKFQEIKATYDSVYRVTKVDIKDFGSPDMWHFEIGGN